MIPPGRPSRACDIIGARSLACVTLSTPEPAHAGTAGFAKHPANVLRIGGIPVQVGRLAAGSKPDEGLGGQEEPGHRARHRRAPGQEGRVSGPRPDQTELLPIDAIDVSVGVKVAWPALRSDRPTVRAREAGLELTMSGKREPVTRE